MTECRLRLATRRLDESHVMSMAKSDMMSPFFSRLSFCYLCFYCAVGQTALGRMEITNKTNHQPAWSDNKMTVLTRSLSLIGGIDLGLTRFEDVHAHMMITNTLQIRHIVAKCSIITSCLAKESIGILYLQVTKRLITVNRRCKLIPDVRVISVLLSCAPGPVGFKNYLRLILDQHRLKIKIISGMNGTRWSHLEILRSMRGKLAHVGRR